MQRTRWVPFFRIVYILGEVVSKISSSNTIVLSGNIQKSVAKGTQLAIRVNGVKNFNLSSPGRHCIGANIIGSTYIDKSGSLIFSYHNKSLSFKTFSYELEYCTDYFSKNFYIMKMIILEKYFFRQTKRLLFLYNRRKTLF